MKKRWSSRNDERQQLMATLGTLCIPPLKIRTPRLSSYHVRSVVRQAAQSHFPPPEYAERDPACLCQNPKYSGEQSRFERRNGQLSATGFGVMTSCSGRRRLLAIFTADFWAGFKVYHITENRTTK